MAEAGISHQPDMADQMMRELAPLLAEEGVDIDNLTDDVDLDTLNAALASATERYNMELFTPVGAERDQATGVLKQFSDAVHRGNNAQAQRILDAVEPEPSAQYPSASQLIGTSLDLLDRWFSASPQPAGLARVKVPSWDRPARDAGNDLLGLAPKGRAYQSLDSLIVRHAGRALADGAALLIAATLEAVAVSEQRAFTEVSDEYLPSDSAGSQPVAPAASGSAFGPAAEAAVASNKAVAEFGAWLDDHANLARFQSLAERAIAEGIDPHAPQNIGDLIELAFTERDPGTVDRTIEVIHDYLHFQLETGDDPHGWNQAHEAFQEFTAHDDTLMSALQEKLGEFEDVDDHQRWAVMQGLPIVAAVGPLLDWIGASAPITSTGVPRRADIETVAGMIGIPAVGVAKSPGFTGGLPLEDDLSQPPQQPETVYVQSALEVAGLMAWWEALLATGVIELTSTRVRPGPEAEAFLAGRMPVEEASELISMFVTEVLTQEVSRTDVKFFSHFLLEASSRTVMRIVGAVIPEVMPGGAEVPELTPLVTPRSVAQIRRLQRAGVVDVENGELQVREELQLPVVAGAMMATAVLRKLGPEE